MLKADEFEMLCIRQGRFSAKQTINGREASSRRSICRHSRWCLRDTALVSPCAVSLCCLMRSVHGGCDPSGWPGAGITFPSTRLGCCAGVVSVRRAYRFTSSPCGHGALCCWLPFVLVSCAHHDCECDIRCRPCFLTQMCSSSYSTGAVARRVSGSGGRSLLASSCRRCCPPGRSR